MYSDVKSSVQQQIIKLTINICKSKLKFKRNKLRHRQPHWNE